MFIVMHGTKSVHTELCQLLEGSPDRAVPFGLVEALIEKTKLDFYNWIVFTLNYTSCSAVAENVFERTVVAHRRGLSREGRDILASQGLLMETILYEKRLSDLLDENVYQQK